MANESTVKNIANLKNLKHLSQFCLWNIPEIFNLEHFSIFIKNRINTQFILRFNRNISEQYKYQINSLIDAIIESKFPNRLIEYNGQDYEKEKIMSNRYQW
uniref:Uncharacterized protein n=1 Tax=Panagrolaimus sp. ES5 TaxID=591445 RepID=A0AC34G5Y6_9BILA